MSEPVTDVARRLFELRELTKREVAKAQADETEIFALVHRLGVLVKKYGIEGRIYISLNFRKGHLREQVEERARVSAAKLASAVIMLPSADATEEAAVDRRNEDEMRDEEKGLPNPVCGRTDCVSNHASSGLHIGRDGNAWETPDVETQDSPPDLS